MLWRLALALLLLAAASSSAVSPLDAFLPAVASTRATGGSLAPPFDVADAEACAEACLANASTCISFNFGSAQQPLTKTCGIVEECWAPNASSCPSFLTLSCVGGVFTGVSFASYGLPVVEPGQCAFAATPSCDAGAAARAVFESACVGQSWCSVNAQLVTFGADPCEGRVKFVAASLAGAGCSDAPPPPAQPTCELSGYSRTYELAAGAGNVSYFQRLQPRNDSAVAPAVAYALDVPTGGVSLEGSGLLAQAFATNLEFLVNGSRGSLDDLLLPYRRRHNASANWPGAIWSWDGFVPGSVASMLLMGAGGALRWTEHAALRATLSALIGGISAVVEADGYAFGYPKEETNADMGGNNQLPSYVNSWFTHGMLEASVIDPRALSLARATNSWWNNCTYLPQLFPQDGGDDHAGPVVNGYDPERGMTSTSPFAHGHLLYWLNQAGIGHSRMAMSRAGTQADVDFLMRLFKEDWWLDMLAARNKSAIYLRKWYPDNYIVCVLECYLDLYTLTGDAHLLDAVRGGWELFRDPLHGWLFPGGSFAINENYLYPPGSFPLEFEGSWGVTTRPTGELCPSSFWIYLNKRFHRLFPLEEAYVWEMERSLINVGMAGQSPAGVRYFARLHGVKDPATSKGTCCEGQSVRVFGAAPEHIFTASPLGDIVSVDLYEAATATFVRAAPVGATTTVTVATGWPFATRADILVTASAAAPLTLNVRVPAWAAPSPGSANVSILIDGVPRASGAPGSYVVLALSAGPGRAVNVSLELAMAPAALPYTGVTQKPGHSRFAYTFGPFLLAAVGPWDAGLDCVVVAGVNASRPEDWLEPPAGTPPGALPAAGFAVRGLPSVTFESYYAIGAGTRFTVYPIVDA